MLGARINDPMPDFVSPVAEPLLAIVEEIISGWALFWITTKSAPLAPSSAPPEIESADVTDAGTRIPPVVIGTVPLSNTLAPTAPLSSRRLFAADELLAVNDPVMS